MSSQAVKMKSATRRTQRRKLVVPKDAQGVKVGWPEGSGEYPDGTKVVDVAVYNEFGTETIEERSSLRAGIADNLAAIKHSNRASLRSITRGESTVKRELELLGTTVADMVRAKIVEVDSPPNADSTVERKGSSNPLIDTGHMRQAVRHEVIK